ncbi:MAG: transporter related [Paenibacillus sp.]|jgi:branched-chain amino acid transport system ATP-binding protein|nr:transporter related [Paenibacillus sp.]
MLHVRNLHSGYRGIEVLSGVSLDVPAGKIASVIGANGAGKTTLMRTLSGTITSSSGEILFEGEHLEQLPSHQIVRKGLIHCPEGRELFPQMTIEQNLLLGAFTQKSKQKRKESFEKVFSVFPRLKERLQQKAGTLSGGEQQMCAIARGMMAAPKLLILDEPSLGLSPKMMDEMFSLVLRINEDLGTTILLVEQNVAESLEVSHFGYVLQTGKVVASGHSEELSNNPLILKAYLGI